MKKWTLASLLVLGTFGVVQHAEAATLTVCASGCGYTNLNAALAAASGGDVITMAEDETFTQCSVLPNKGNQTPIQIRSSALDANLPAAGVRFDPATHGSRVAILQACSLGNYVISAALGAQDYIIGPGLKFLSVGGGFGAMLEIGSNSSSQDLRADQPDSIVVDRNWLAGDPIVGQKIGVDMNGSNITVTNNYIDEIHGVGQDAIAVRCINGDGPYVVENNFLAAAAENFICGGDDPQMRTFATVNAGATTTSATLSSLSNSHPISELRVGQLIAFQTGANTQRYHTYVRSCGTSTPGASCSSTSITYDAIPVAPDTGTGSDARFGSIPDNIRIRRNHFYKRLAWRDPILGTVGTVTPVASNPSGATLAAGTYYYRVVARVPTAYQNNPINGTASVEVQCTVTANGQCALSWAAVTNATRYRVFRGTAPGGQTGYFEVTTNSATDNGIALTASSIPSVSKWSVKNLFEIKYGTNYQIDSNIFENSWTGVDNGQGIWLKSNNSVGSADFAQTKNVIFERNKIFNVPGCFNILGRNENGNDAPAIMENLVIRNNACYDSGMTWVDPDDHSACTANINEPIIGLTIENNTFINNMKCFFLLIATSGPQVTGFVVRNNIGFASTNGIFAAGYSGTVKGISSLEAFSPGYVFAGNVLCGASASAYPTGNIYPTDAVCTGSVNFTDYANDDYTIKSDSPWKGTAVGGGDPGVNWAVLNSATTGVASGATETTTPVNITTAATLTTITQGAACSGLSASFAATGGTSPYVWTRPAGSWPAGCTVSSAGAWSGTTTTPGSGSFTMRATDAAAAWDEQGFTWTINPTSSTLAFVTGATLDAGEVTRSVSLQLQCSGGTAPYTYDVSSGSVPSWASLSPSGLYVGIPDSTTAASFTARCTDAVGATATRAFTQTIANESMSCTASANLRLRTYRVNGLTFEKSTFRRPTAPTTGWPDCVKKNDSWENTATGQSFKVTSINPLTFTAIEGGTGTVDAGTVSVEGTPAPGDLIVRGDDGRWQSIPKAEFTGLDASAITSGQINPARLSQALGGATLYFHVPETGSATWAPRTTDQSNCTTAGTALACGEAIGTASKRQQFDTTRFTQIKLIMRVQGAHSLSTAKCFMKYSLDDNIFVAITGGDLFVNVAGTRAGEWATIPEAAKTETTVWQVFCNGGNDSSTFAQGSTAAQFR